MESDPTPGTYGIKKGDYLGAKMMDFTPVLTAMMGLDYNSSSIGIDFGAVAPGIKKIQIIPDGKFRAHRVTQRTLDLYTSPDNTIYTMASRSNWSFTTDSNGVITITLKESVATRYLKIHVKFDERDSGFTAKSKATFLNDLAKMLRVYQEATLRTEDYQYDKAGNRTFQVVTLIHSNTYKSLYYANSDRLQTDGKFAFKYDEAGNLVKKGNQFNINGDTVTYTATSGEGVEYWQYTYDLLNRLTEVSKNGTVVSEYEYSPDGLREVKRGSSGTVHYVFEGTEPIFEKRISVSRVRSYVYALGKHLARVDGVIGDSSAKVYYYHTDNVGSVKAVTDQSGKVVFNADYFAFGTKYTSNGDFDEAHGFTGKEYDSDAGLYYYNARWYDGETGRFISEDPVADPNNPNLYTYCANNPLTNTDPTGLDVGWYGEPNQGGNSGYNDGKYNWSGGSSSSDSSNNNDKDKTKKSFLDNIKDWYNKLKDSQDQAEKARNEKLINKAKDYLKGKGITEEDPDYKEKLDSTFRVMKMMDTPLEQLKDWFKNDPDGQKVYKSIFGDPDSKLLTGTVDLFGFEGILKDTGIIAKNIENLREWAKQNGWVQKFTEGGVEMWGQVKDGEFSWRVKIKPEASTREGLVL